MKNFSALILALLPLIQALPSKRADNITDGVTAAQIKYDAYRAESTANMKAILATRTSGCTLENVLIRKEWTTLSTEERLEYIGAVQCLKAALPITPADIVPGIRSRFDDFQALHINQSSFIHWTTYFNPWHRYLEHAYETALRDECGYTGAQPYWDWSKNGGNITAQEIFSGADDSFGSDGTYVPHGQVAVLIPATPPYNFTIYQPAGTGGGCLKDGPFKDFIIPIGPLGPPFSDTWGEYNPRCIERDFRPATLMAANKYENVTTLLEKPEIVSFMASLNSVHGAGHGGIGGLQSDLFASNGDPAFYMHHGQMDHVWAMWQALDWENRKNAITGTLTLMNLPPSEEGTLETTMDLGYNGGTLTSGDLASTIDGPFCYIYE